MRTILHVVPKINRGGVASVVLNLYESINKKEYKFIIVTHDEDDFSNLRSKYPELEIYSIESIRTLGISKYKRKLKHLLFKIDYNILHIHLGHLVAFYGYLYNSIKKTPTILHSHTTRVVNKKHKILMPLLRKFMIKKDYTLIACTKKSGQFCFGTKKFKIIENGLNYDKFQSLINTSQEPNYIKEIKLNYPNDIILCNVANFDYPKNHYFLIDMFEELMKYKNNYWLILVGEGLLESKIKTYSKEKKVDHRIHFFGKRSDVPYIIHRSDIFVLPSLYEALPVSVLEAQALNKYVLLSDRIDNTVMINNQNGRFLDIENTHIWVNTIKQYDKSKVINNNFSDSKFNIANIIVKLEQIYKNIAMEK